MGDGDRGASDHEADDNGSNQAGSLCWLWMAATQAVAFLKICAGRGREALRQLLGQTVARVVNSDWWSACNIVDLNWRRLYCGLSQARLSQMG